MNLTSDIDDYLVMINDNHYFDNGMLAIIVSDQLSAVVLSTVIFRCWVNLGNQISYGTILPVIFCVLLSAILTEAATMGDLKRLPLTPKDKYTAAL